MMSPLTFGRTLEAADPGDVITYHSGRSLEGCKAATTALAAYYQGRVELVQQRLLNGNFAYQAIVRRDVRRPPVHRPVENLVRKLLRIPEGKAVA